MVLRYNRPSSSRGRKRLLIATLVVLAVVLVDVLSGGFVRTTLRGAAAVFDVFGRDAAARVTATGFFTSKRSLQAQNQALSLQVAHLAEQAASAAALTEENEHLRNLAHLASGLAGITAPVVSPLTASPYGTFLIKASGDSVKVGDLVLTEGGFVLGSVSEVGAGTALVTELFGPDSEFDASLGGAVVHVVGQGGGQARASVSRDLGVSEGDAVFAPQYGARPVGIVGAVASTSASASQQVYIRLPSSLASIRFVYVASH